MGIFLIILATVFLISVITFGCIWNTYDYQSVKARLSKVSGHVMIWAAAFALLYGVITVVSLTNSYNSYLDSRAYYDNLISQYKGAITLYEDKAVALDMEKAATHALTDLRFSGYQDKMGDFIMDLRKTITRYNKCIIKKRIMKKNFFYGWYIIPPDKDMHTVDIVNKR